MKLLDYAGLQYFYSKLLTKFNAITTSISAITKGTTTVGNADKLDGNDSSYFATASALSTTNSNVTKITNGTTKVGNADKLDGNDSSYFATASALSTTNSNVTKITNGTTTVGNADKLDGYHASDLIEMFVPTTGGKFTGNVEFEQPISILNAGGEEGAEMSWACPITNHSFGGPITQDIWTNSMRIFATHDNATKIFDIDFSTMKGGRNTALHTGISAKTVISPNAPTDMANTLWVVP